MLAVSRRLRALGERAVNVLPTPSAAAGAASTPADVIRRTINEAIKNLEVNSVSIRELAALYAALERFDEHMRASGIALEPDADVDGYMALIEQELCMQRTMEANWSNLVHSMVANCSNIDGSLRRVQDAVEQAIRSVAGRDCEAMPSIDLPPTLETSLDTFVERVDRIGAGRPNRLKYSNNRT
jgi:hypothetical protein